MCTVMHSEGLEYEHCQRLFDWAYSQPAPAQPVTTMAASVKASAPPEASRTAEPSPSATGTDQAPAADHTDTGPQPWLIAVPLIGGLAALIGGVAALLRRRRSGS